MRLERWARWLVSTAPDWAWIVCVASLAAVTAWLLPGEEERPALQALLGVSVAVVVLLWGPRLVAGALRLNVRVPPWVRWSLFAAPVVAVVAVQLPALAGADLAGWARRAWPLVVLAEMAALPILYVLWRASDFAVRRDPATISKVTRSPLVSFAVYLGLWAVGLTFLAMTRQHKELPNFVACVVALAGIGLLSRIQLWETSPLPEGGMAKIEQVRAAERLHIDQRREKLGVQRPRTVGLCLSGGGIRSATTSLGFLHELSRRRDGARPLVDHFDYLSTVSGGGWAGVGWLCRLVTAWKGEGDPEARWRKLAHTFRAHGDYLIPGGPGPTVNTLAPVFWLITGAMFNALSTLSFGVAVICVVHAGSAKPDGISMSIGGMARSAFDALHLSDRFRLLPGIRAQLPAADALLAVVLLAAIGLVVALGVMATGFVMARRKYRHAGSRLGAWSLAIGVPATLLVLVLGGNRFVTYVAAGAVVCAIVASRAKGLSRGSLLTVLASVFSAESGLLGYFAPGAIRDATDAWAGTVESTVLAPLRIVGDTEAWRHDPGAAALATAGGLAALGILAGFLVNRNLSSLHGYWDEKIRRGFLFAGSGPREDDELCLRSLPEVARALAGSTAPWPIVNAAINTPGSTDATLKMRGTARFEFTPHHVGGPATGWAGAGEFGQEITLSRAVAVSAAAVNSQGGDTIPRFARALLGAANAGLGIWVRNPLLARTPPDARFRLLWHFWSGYTWKDLLGWNSEKDSLVFVSDGGHHENLGLTALVERECDVVVALDAGCDPSYGCDDLARALLLLGVDGGWEVADGGDALDTIRPTRAGGTWAERKAETSVLRLVLRRPGSEVVVYYVKNGLTPAMPLEVRNYAEKNLSFPHETTADQFFGEHQFEAYRLLGEHLARQLRGRIAADLA